MVFKRCRTVCGDPVFLRRFHGWATVFWVVMAVPSMLWWRSSLPYLVGLSVYAVVTGHWSSWQASRAEVKIDAP